MYPMIFRSERILYAAIERPKKKNVLFGVRQVIKKHHNSHHLFEQDF